MEAEGATLRVEPLIAYPTEASPGGRYVMRVDLQHAFAPAEWPYPEEEYALTCLVDAHPYFSCESTTDPTIVLHRYGGSYGAALFLLIAGEHSGVGSIRLTLLARSGMPLKTFELGVEVDAKHAEALPHVRERTPQRSATDTATTKPDILRWVHISDLMTQEAPPLEFPYFKDAGDVPMDALFVTGDLSYAATEAQFSHVHGFLEFARANLAAAAVPAFVVPGNHDCDRDVVSHQPELQRLWSTPGVLQALWNGRKTKQSKALSTALRAAFAPFERLQRRLLGDISWGPGLMPADFSATFHSASGAKVGVVGLNSALASLVYASQFGNMVLSVKQLEAVCGDADAWASQHDVTVLMMHHTPEWFTEESRAELDKITQLGRFDLILVGGANRGPYNFTKPGGPSSNAWYRASGYRAHPTDKVLKIATGRVFRDARRRRGQIEEYDFRPDNRVWMRPRGDRIDFELGAARQERFLLRAPLRFAPRQEAAVEAQITQALARFQKYLEHLGANVKDSGAVTIRADSDQPVGYYLPGSTPTIVLGKLPAGNDAALFHPYTHHALLHSQAAKSSRRSALSYELEALESGLSLYFPCSFAESPHAGLDYASHESLQPSDLTRPGALLAEPTSDRSSAILTAGERWAGALWDLRILLGAHAVDRLAMKTWEDVIRGEPSLPRVAFRVRVLEHTLEHSPRVFERVNQALSSRGLDSIANYGWLVPVSTFATSVDPRNAKGWPSVGFASSNTLARAVRLRRFKPIFIILVGATLLRPNEPVNARVVLQAVRIEGRRSTAPVPALATALDVVARTQDDVIVRGEANDDEWLDNGTRELLEVAFTVGKRADLLLVLGVPEAGTNEERAIHEAGTRLSSFMPALEIAWRRGKRAPTATIDLDDNLEAALLGTKTARKKPAAKKTAAKKSAAKSGKKKASSKPRAAPAAKKKTTAKKSPKPATKKKLAKKVAKSRRVKKAAKK